MKNGETLVIRQVGNGFVVEPLVPAHSVVPIAEMLVFNDMGFSAGNRDDSTVPCLLGFIERHFAQGKGESR